MTDTRDILARAQAARDRIDAAEAANDLPAAEVALAELGAILKEAQQLAADAKRNGQRLLRSQRIPSTGGRFRRRVSRGPRP